MTEEIEKEAYILALQNAILHGGKAEPRSVLGRIMARFRNTEAQSALKVVSSAVDLVNSRSIEEQRKELFRLAPELLVKEKKERIRQLRELEGAGPGFTVRLAPYPSGALHIGNSRMIILNDEYAKKYRGKLFLVFDDTIGSEEKLPQLESYTLIREGLEWLGVRWDAEYYKSDRLEIFYAWALRLIRQGIAYVCLCSSEELRKRREEGVACSHRDQTAEENEKLWGKMLSGEFSEGDAVLRAKTDIAHRNPAFRDRVLCRMSDRAHPRVGTKYRVWPMLEFSWAVDDIELGMTHVIRGKDLYMEDLMEKFIWDRLGIKGPRFEHFGLLRISGVKISKSKSMSEVMSGAFSGWDDPRTWSLQSLRARGIRPEAIRSFILNFGMSLNDITVPVDSLYSENRKLIERDAARYYFVDSPVHIRIEGVPQVDFVESMIHPDYPERGKRRIEVDGSVYISSSDAESLDGSEIRLKDYCNIKLQGRTGIFAGRENRELPRIQWVTARTAVPCEIIMPDGSRRTGVAEPSVRNIRGGAPVQFERFGYVNLREKGERMLFYYTHD
ncbi:MAG: glutamate--tRNA ligase [Thermoplasmata archaeon]|uniref:Glutamate--tRNA ligase n=1 Tax=Candidatus Sysuiplasma superficiale TaxID=2823368 RepID=A0A8J7YIK0_9ARCH|nr:glutamate--tRNA ligase [Candidatus Sysuiplasma superficiale]MBX8643688.1 glutamate--tRNA ligase [Candidatus Sysuiplasma superficiale]MCL4346789.1 glutamate--tRNA ligase [Candidatus Thermoplasmatota archaeon]